MPAPIIALTVSIVVARISSGLRSNQRSLPALLRISIQEALFQVLSSLPESSALQTIPWKDSCGPRRLYASAMDTKDIYTQTLRERYGYKGYLHLKVIPGASPELVKLAMRYATRVSVNIELPTEESLVRIAPDKSADSILSPMKTIYERLRELDESNRSKKTLQEISIGDKQTEMSAGQTTQLIVGASPESDHTILSLAYHLYRDLGVRRVYYSAFRPEGTDPSLPRLAAPPYIREYRLYQADMLFRWYDFEPIELFEAQDSLDEDLDPKTSWALRHLELFPVELMTADYEELLRIPGIGPKAACKILTSLDELYGSKYSIEGRKLENPEMLREMLREKKQPPSPVQQEFDFLS